MNINDPFSSEGERKNKKGKLILTPPYIASWSFHSRGFERWLSRNQFSHCSLTAAASLEQPPSAHRDCFPRQRVFSSTHGCENVQEPWFLRPVVPDGGARPPADERSAVTPPAWIFLCSSLTCAAKGNGKEAAQAVHQGGRAVLGDGHTSLRGPS